VELSSRYAITDDTLKGSIYIAVPSTETTPVLKGCAKGVLSIAGDADLVKQKQASISFKGGKGHRWDSRAIHRIEAYQPGTEVPIIAFQWSLPKKNTTDPPLTVNELFGVKRPYSSWDKDTILKSAAEWPDSITVFFTIECIAVNNPDGRSDSSQSEE
jgi:hypothetical protein